MQIPEKTSFVSERGDPPIFQKTPVQADIENRHCIFVLTPNQPNQFVTDSLYLRQMLNWFLSGNVLVLCIV